MKATKTNNITKKRSPLHFPQFRVYAALVIVGAVCLYSNVALASGDDPLGVVNNLSTFIFSIIRAIGLIMLGFGIVQFGLSLKTHDPSQRANSFLTIAGGIVITFAKESASVTC